METVEKVEAELLARLIGHWSGGERCRWRRRRQEELGFAVGEGGGRGEVNGVLWAVQASAGGVKALSGPPWPHAARHRRRTALLATTRRASSTSVGH